MERRSLLKTALASATLPGCFLSPAAAAICKAAPYVPQSDPLATVIAEYFHQSAIFNARADEEDWGELLAATYGPARDRMQSPPEPTSLAGVAAAIRFARDDPDSGAVRPVMDACLRYLDRESQS
ncbi:MAG: hypothetical protein J0I42_18160 [Bosea sp.]|uniref:hypothetical protein n=1 Tax=Bosea sp. (in: a-proteobacteria) TaxID=1871050 RepID=UPI001ACEF04B|nr:hypothetical protein [Bosea sp. (in: a-proteobacteria)]MBN9453867.1 hypothetical protein [Bosea sp. (in: a-proteobacteria)]